MPALSDVRFEALRGLGLTGSTSDMLYAWLLIETGFADRNSPGAPQTIADAWQTFLLAKVPDAKERYQRNDFWYAYLGLEGYTGSLNDRELQHWEAVLAGIP